MSTNDSSPTLSSLRRTLGRVSKGWNAPLVSRSPFPTKAERCDASLVSRKRLIAIQWRLMSLVASWGTVTLRILPRVAMTTDTGRVSEISQRRPSLWEVVLAFWKRRRVSAETPACFAATLLLHELQSVRPQAAQNA